MRTGLALLTGGGRARSVRLTPRPGGPRSARQLPAVHDAARCRADVSRSCRRRGPPRWRAWMTPPEPNSTICSPPSSQSAAVMAVETFEREMSKLGRILSRDDGVSRMVRLRPAALRAPLGRSGHRDVSHPSASRPGDRCPHRQCPRRRRRLGTLPAAGRRRRLRSSQGRRSGRVDHRRPHHPPTSPRPHRAHRSEDDASTVLTSTRCAETGDGQPFPSTRCAGSAATPTSPRSPSTTTGSR